MALIQRQTFHKLVLDTAMCSVTQVFTKLVNICGNEEKKGLLVESDSGADFLIFTSTQMHFPHRGDPLAQICVQPRITQNSGKRAVPHDTCAISFTSAWVASCTMLAQC